MSTRQGPPGKQRADSLGVDRSLTEETRAVLRDFRAHAKHQLGQHFLIDQEALDSIVHTADLRPDEQVLEIGPGIGTLTRALAETGAIVNGLEIDAEMVYIAKARTAHYLNVRIHEGNCLHADLGAILDPRYPFKVIANIPYYITAPILRLFLEGAHRPQLLVLMVQHEVGERLAARPGEMSALTVFTQVHAAVQIMRMVPSSSFLPPPEVASAVLRLVPREQPIVLPADQPFLFRVVKAGFGSKRKMLHNALNNGLPNRSAVIDDALETSGIERTRRAETVSIEEWIKLAAALATDPEHRPRGLRSYEADVPRQPSE